MTEKTQDQIKQDEDRKTYEKPEIIHDIELETRAGSPLGFPDPFGPDGLGQ